MSRISDTECEQCRHSYEGADRPESYLQAVEVLEGAVLLCPDCANQLKQARVTLDEFQQTDLHFTGEVHIEEGEQTKVLYLSIIAPDEATAKSLLNKKMTALFKGLQYYGVLNPPSELSPDNRVQLLPPFK